MAGVVGGTIGLGRGVVYNLLGLSAPLLAALFAIPPLVALLGVERFGLLAVIWVVIGYFGLFDLGLGRALTQRTADALGRGANDEIPRLASTALMLMALLGVVGALAVAALSAWGASRMAGGDLALAAEANDAFLVLALSIPVVVTAAGLRGLLEAHGRFGAVNLNRAAMGVLMFAAPLAVASAMPRLDVVVTALLTVRVLSWLGYWRLCRRAGWLRAPFACSAPAARGLLGFGGWMTVTNIVGPIMDSLDRVLIGLIAGAAAVAYYATPAEMVTKVLILPAAVATAFFPALTAAWAQGAERPRQLYRWGLQSVSIAVLPAAAILILLAPDILALWLDPAFATRGATVMRWLAFGVLFNSLAQIPFAAIQAAGRPRDTALLHLVELPLYLLALWLLLDHAGVVGAAWAWAGRAAGDGLALFVMAQRRLALSWRALVAPALGGGLALVALAAGCFVESIMGRIAYLCAFLAVFFVLAWARMLAPVERAWVVARLRR